MWNIHAGELWRRTTIAINRHLPSRHRIQYAKVAEYQHRGAVHFHALIRVDEVNPDDPTSINPPYPGITADHLRYFVEDAVAGTVFDTEPHPVNQDGWTIALGEQLDIRTVNLAPADHDDAGRITTTAVAGYLAKYATKATEDTGFVSKRINGEAIELLAAIHGETHQIRQLRACWGLGTRPYRYRSDKQREAWREGWGRLQHWAHMLGYGGHFSTKSRRYSTTLGALRAVRKAFQRGENPDAPTLPAPTSHDDDDDGDQTDIIVNYTFEGTGWLTTADAQLANTAAAKAREYRQTARQEFEDQLFGRD